MVDVIVNSFGDFLKFVRTHRPVCINFRKPVREPVEGIIGITAYNDDGMVVEYYEEVPLGKDLSKRVKELVDDLEEAGYETANCKYIS